jgi:hypothetical protein
MREGDDMTIAETLSSGFDQEMATTRRVPERVFRRADACVLITLALPKAHRARRIRNSGIEMQ